MKNLFHVVLLLNLVYSAGGNTINSNERKQSWLPTSIVSKYSATELANSKKVFELGSDDALELKFNYIDNLGIKHYEYLQAYKGIPVEGAILLIHEKKQLVNSANGNFVKNLNLNVNPEISPEEAVENALLQLNATEYAWQNENYESMLKQAKQNTQASFYPQPELVIFDPAYSTSPELYKLAYKFDVYALKPLLRKWFYVDAHTGAILKSIDKIHNCNHHQASGSTNYSGTVSFSTCGENGTLSLKSEKNCHIEIFNANKTDLSLPINFETNSNQFNNAHSAIEVFWTLQNAYNYIDSTFSFEGVNNSDLPVYSWVNFKENFNNAFWNGSWLSFGQGDGTNYGPFTSPDIVAHEYLHYITDYSANLSYYGESGALNESFSDIFGEVIEKQVYGTNDWIIGKDVVITPGKTGMRSMMNPTSSQMITQQPATYQGPYWYTGFADNGGVHINSGVQNHWFYLLSEGDSITNFEGNYFEIEGIGIEKAAAIAYRNLTVYLTENATYLDAYYGSIQAAIDLFNANSNEVAQTKAAWCAVNIGTSCIIDDNKDCYRNVDSLALIALYNSTDGANWINNWNLNNPMDTWHGVTTNFKGCVQFIDLHNNNLSGALPADLGNLKYLKRLRISNSSTPDSGITGSLPPEIGEMESLNILNLSYQNIDGNLPVELSNLTNLNSLILPGNNLGGNIPGFLNNIGSLQEINLSYNNFTGELPNLSLLQNLLTLKLSGNKLNGNIPASFSNLIQLELLALQNNNLSGCYPGGLASVCSHLYPLYNNNQWVSNGNNFEQNWEDFCLDGSGTCIGESTIGPVYPGDFNQNGLVEISDLLYWGLAFGETGAERPDTSSNWEPKDCIEWQNFVNGINNKHQDANGNGIINQDDIEVFLQNFNRGALTSSNQSTSSPIKFVLEPVSSIKNGNEIVITYDLRIESLINQPVTSHGLACKINFNDLPVNEIDVYFDNTCLEQTEDLSIYNIDDNELNIAITKTSKSLEVCDDFVARLVVIIDELQSSEPYVIAINGGTTISNTGAVNTALNQSIYGVLSFDQTATATFTTQVQTTDEQCNSLGSAVVDVVGGSTPYTYSWSNGATTAMVSDLPGGSYSVTVNDSAGNANTIDIVINSPQPVFDYQTGEQLCGNGCLEVLDLNNSVTGGYYKANQLIETNGKLIENSQVTFKAGNRIRLQSGFSTSQSQHFSAKIGNCDDQNISSKKYQFYTKDIKPTK